MRVRINNELIRGKLRFRIRLDFEAEEKTGRFFFGGKSCEEMAELVRKEQINLLQNIPLPGIIIEDFDDSLEIYVLNSGEQRRKKEIAYAPLKITLQADYLESIFPLLLRPEFKKVEVLSPENLNLDKLELERLLYAIFNYKYEKSR
ncbi:MAG: hypothetical protein ACOX7U_00985 [Desulfitobacteriia bacterium]